jgi:hypothetical protein
MISDPEAMSLSLSRRAIALVLSGGGTLFWLWTFHAIGQAPEGDGTGFQWLAVFPLGMVFLVLTLPALLLAISGRWLPSSIALGGLGLIAFAVLWAQLLREFLAPEQL